LKCAKVVSNAAVFNQFIGDNCMKKSLLALAVVGAFASTAQAQSSVTLFGIVDAAFARVSGSTSKTGLTNSGLNSSRLGFRGVEDLGGGLKASFHIEGALSNDDGNAGGLTFQRRSTVSLSGGFGEIRLGRDYTPTFWNTTVFDAFGTNGVGQSNTPGMLGSPANITAVRSNNSIGYFLPAMGGFYGQAMIGFGEQASGAATSKDGNYFGIRFGYANGPLNVAFANGKVKNAAVGGVTTTNFGASYNFGAVAPAFFYGTEKTGAGAKIKAFELSATAPLGGGELRAAYSKYDRANTTSDWRKFALGYGYNLSKRTQVYGTYARVTNGGVSTNSVTNNGLGGIVATPGGGSTGFELGVRHSF
jgi:predicted porin